MNENVFEIHRKFSPLIRILEKDKEYKNIDTVIITGGRYSFKSYTVSGILSLAMVKYGWKTLYTRYTMESAEDSVIAEVNEKMELFGFSSLVKTTKRRIVPANSNEDEDLDNSLTPQIVFKGIKTSSGNQTANLKSLKGFNCFVLDEAEEHPDYKNFKTIQRSIRRRDLQNISILMLNSATKEHWIYKELFEKKGINGGYNGIKDNVCYIHTTYLDMLRFVPDNILNDFNSAKEKDINDYNHNILGAWKEKSDGVIFKNWRIGEFDLTLPYYFGADYGFRPDPDVLVKVAIDTKKRIIYCDSVFRDNEILPTDLVQKIKAYAGTRIAVHSDSAEQRINRMLENAGVKVYPTKKYPNSVSDGIKMMQDYEIIVTENSISLIKELNNYVEKNGQPLSNGNDHEIDAVRYVIMGVLTIRPKQFTRASL